VVRELLAEIATELYRLTRRAERRRAARPATAAPDLLDETLAAAPPLVERLAGAAARLDTLDAVLEVGSEGELMQGIARLERAAAAPDADREALAAAKRDAEAALERRATAEQDRARLAAALCRLLGDLRRTYRQLREIAASDDAALRALEAARADLDAYLGSA
jgi:hypothetical protein